MFAVGWLAVNLIMARSGVEPYSASNPGKKSSSLEGGSEGARREGWKTTDVEASSEFVGGESFNKDKGILSS